MSSSPCPRSAQYATTSHRYVSMSQRRMTEVSSPPEYANTTFCAFFPTRCMSSVARRGRQSVSGGTPCGRPVRRRLSLWRGVGDGPVAHSEKFDDDAFLGVKTVFRLVEDHALRPIEDRVGDLLSPVCGKTMHDERAPRSEAQQRLIHLIALERLQA